MITTLLLFDGKTSSSGRIAGRLACLIGSTRAAEIGSAPEDLSPYNGFCFVFNYYGAVTAGRIRAYISAHREKIAGKRVVLVGVGFSDMGYPKFVADIERENGIEGITGVFISSEDDAPRVGYEVGRLMRTAVCPMPDDELLERIELYIEQHNTLALATSGDGFIRCTPADYRYLDRAFYLITGGGLKFRGIFDNGNVSAAIFDPYSAAGDMSSLQFSGKASVIPEDSEEYGRVMDLYGYDDGGSSATDLFLVKILPLRYEYFDGELARDGYDVNQTLETDFLRKVFEEGAEYATSVSRAERTNEEAAQELMKRLEEDRRAVSSDGGRDETSEGSAEGSGGTDGEDESADAPDGTEGTPELTGAAGEGLPVEEMPVSGEASDSGAEPGEEVEAENPEVPDGDAAPAGEPLTGEPAAEEPPAEDSLAEDPGTRYISSEDRRVPAAEEKPDISAETFGEPEEDTEGNTEENTGEPARGEADGTGMELPKGLFEESGDGSGEDSQKKSSGAPFRMPSFMKPYIGNQDDEEEFIGTDGRSMPLPEIDMSVLKGLEPGGRHRFDETDGERETKRKAPVTFVEPEETETDLEEEYDEDDSPVLESARPGKTESGRGRKEPRRGKKARRGGKNRAAAGAESAEPGKRKIQGEAEKRRSGVFGKIGKAISRMLLIDDMDDEGAESGELDPDEDEE